MVAEACDPDEGAVIDAVLRYEFRHLLGPVPGYDREEHVQDRSLPSDFMIADHYLTFYGVEVLPDPGTGQLIPASRGVPHPELLEERGPVDLWDKVTPGHEVALDPTAGRLVVVPREVRRREYPALAVAEDLEVLQRMGARVTLWVECGSRNLCAHVRLPTVVLCVGFPDEYPASPPGGWWIAKFSERAPLEVEHVLGVPWTSDGRLSQLAARLLELQDGADDPQVAAMLQASADRSDPVGTSSDGAEVVFDPETGKLVVAIQGHALLGWGRGVLDPELGFAPGGTGWRELQRDESLCPVSQVTKDSIPIEWVTAPERTVGD